MGSVDDGRCLSNVRFMKTKFTNRLTIHLDLVIRMFAHRFFTSDTFPLLAVMSVFHRHSDPIVSYLHSLINEIQESSD
jgi:hypothetical protein